MGQNMHVNEHVGQEIGHGLYVTQRIWTKVAFLKKQNKTHQIYTSNAAIQS